ncbi:MAG: glycosyltransferase family 39 protein [DPANN group archaeon]|nr:glycosyltransferase family 39 protein [DPANN group archaeon]
MPKKNKELLKKTEIKKTQSVKKSDIKKTKSVKKLVKSKNKKSKFNYDKLFDTKFYYDLLVKHKEILFLLFFFGYIYFSTISSYGMFMWDEAGYANIGKSMYEDFEFAQNGQIETGRNYGFPLLIATSFFIFGDTTDTVAKMSVLFSSLLTIFVVYFFVRRIINKNTAILSAFILGILPLFWSNTAHLLSEVPFTTFFTISILSFYHGIKSDKRYLYLAWASLGFSYTIRYNAMLFGPPIILYMLTLFVLDWKKTFNLVKTKEFLLSPFLFVLVTIPYYILMYMNGVDFIEQFKLMSGGLSQYALVVSSIPSSFFIVQLPNNLTFFLMILMLIGVVYVLKTKNEFGIYLLSHILMALLYFSSQAWKESRFVLSLTPLYAILIAIAFMNVLYPILKRDIKSKNVVYLIMFVILLFAAKGAYTSAMMPLTYSIANGYPALLQSSEFIKNNVGEDETFMAVGPQYNWYADRIVTSYGRNITDVVSILEANPKIRFIVINNYERSVPSFLLESFSTIFNQDDFTSGYVFIFGDEKNKFRDIVIESQYYIVKVKPLLN